MPIYCYRKDDGEVIGLHFSEGNAPDEVTYGDGKTAVRDDGGATGCEDKNAAILL